MKFKGKICAALFACLILLSSCNPGPGSSVAEILDVDVSTIPATGKTISVSKNTLVKLDNVNLKDGFFIGSSTGREIVGTNSRAEENRNLFQTQGGGYIIVPDDGNHAEFTGGDVNVRNSSTMLIRQFQNIDDDLEIASSEPKYSEFSTGEVAEEFYYIDFQSDSRFKDIDKTRVVVVGPTSGGFSEYSIVQYGSFDQMKQGLLDFSSFDGFGLYLYRANGGNDVGEWSSKCHVLSPITVSAGYNTELENDVYVLDIPFSDGAYYKLTISYDSENDISSLISQHNERYYDGSPRTAVAIPIVDKDAKTVSFYFGKTDNPFLFDLDFSGFDDNRSFTVSFETSDEASFPGFIDIMKETQSSDYPIIVSDSQAGGYMTLAFRITESKYLEIDFQDTYYLRGSFFLGEHGRGGFPVGISRFDDTTATGFAVIDCRAFQSGQTIGNIHATDTPYVECRHMVWDKNRNLYVCAENNCEHTYRYADMFLLMWTTFNEKLVADIDGIHIELKDCGATVDGLHLGSSENSHGSENEYASLISANNMDHNQRIQVTYKEFWTDGHKLVTKLRGDLEIHVNGTDAQYSDVVFTTIHTHSWQFENDTAECSYCGATAGFSSIQLRQGTAATVNVSGLEADQKLELLIPDIDFSDSLGNGQKSYDAIPVDVMVYFLVENSYADIKVEEQGDGVFSISVNTAE